MRNTNVMEAFFYLPFIGSVACREADGKYYGKIENIPDRVEYEAGDADALYVAFRKAVDDYMAWREREHKRPLWPKLHGFGEYMFWAYANFQMLCYAFKSGKSEYDTECYMIRAKSFKAYKDGRWEINDLYRNNIWKMRTGNYCWYCGKEVASRDELTADHIFPRSKGGDNSQDNLVLVCKECNSSKGNRDVLEWYMRDGYFPPTHIIAHYYKQIYAYAEAHGLLEKGYKEMKKEKLPFNPDCIITLFPAPSFFAMPDE